jgi:hypothetical protein
VKKHYQDFHSYPDFTVVTISIDERGEPLVSQ